MVGACGAQGACVSAGDGSADGGDDDGFWHGGASQVEIQCSLLGECGEKATMRCRDLIRVRLFMEEVRLRMTSYLPSIYLSLRAVPLRGMKMVPGGSTLNFFE